MPIAEVGRYYDSERTIIIRTGLLLEQERRVLWHELVHADRGDRACHVDDKVERFVDRLAREWAMPWSALVWAWEAADDLEEMAGLLRLPQDWVWQRLTELHPARKAHLNRLVDADLRQAGT